MILLSRKFILLTLSLGLIFLSPARISSEIKKRVTDEGTVIYYSEEKDYTRAFKKRNFDSPYNDLIEKISKKAGVDTYLVKCVIRVESNFKADAVSVAGAMGLMQIMQDIARYYNVKDPLNPEENLNAGINHLKSLLDYFTDNVPLALAAYHAGLGRVKKNMKVPPIKSTIAYVDSVMYFYTGKKYSSDKKIKRLYKKINEEGMIEIYSR